jgi:hypothetical protein
MGINVPSSTQITIAAQEFNGEYYQSFSIADDEGNLINTGNPLSVGIVVSGYSSTSTTYQGTVVPVGGVYINDLVGGDFTEMVDGELGTIRLNNRRAVMTASDGQVTILNTSAVNNYHDVMVASGVFSGVTVAAYSSFFSYASSTQVRYVYIPLSRSGFRRVNLYVKHTLVNDFDGLGATIPITVYGDFGQFYPDFALTTATISGIYGLSTGKAFVSYTPTVSGSLQEYIPAFDSPLAGIFVAVMPTTTVTGSFEIYASKSA